MSLLVSSDRSGVGPEDAAECAQGEVLNPFAAQGWTRIRTAPLSDSGRRWTHLVGAGSDRTKNSIYWRENWRPMRDLNPRYLRCEPLVLVKPGQGEAHPVLHQLLQGNPRRSTAFDDRLHKRTQSLQFRGRSELALSVSRVQGLEKIQISGHRRAAYEDPLSKVSHWTD